MAVPPLARVVLAAATLLAGLLGVPPPDATGQVLATPSLTHARRGHTATALADGRVLIIGGEDASGPVAPTEVYDPVARTFAVGPHSLVPRTDHAAVLLADGRVYPRQNSGQFRQAVRPRLPGQPALGYEITAA